MKESKRYKVFKVFNYLILAIIAFVMLFPYVNTLAKAFNQGTDTAKGGIMFLPRIWTLENFITILSEDTFFDAAKLSVIRVIVHTLTALIVQFFTAYALSKKNYPFKKAIMMFFVVSMYFGAGMIPTYVLYSDLGLLNTFWVYILPVLFSFYNATIMRTYMESTIPDSLYESAYLDGANDLYIVFKIALPLSKPVIATVALWLIVGAWNDWTTTLYYTTSPKLHTLQYKMMQVVKEAERIAKLMQEAALAGQDVGEVPEITSDSITAAQVILTTAPIIAIYPFLSKYFVKGMMLGAVKG